jgi:hypothetical protein
MGGHNFPASIFFRGLCVDRNYAALGLATEVNDINPKTQPPEEVTEVPKAEATGLLAAEIKAIEEAPPPPPVQVKSMPVKEQRNLMKMIDKHGDDLEVPKMCCRLELIQVEPMCISSGNPSLT